jgi:amino acid transporter
MAGRPLRFWDLVLYAVAMGLSIRWIAAAAAAGPVSLALWALAAVGFMAPLVIATAELTTRFDGDGGIYAWTARTLGPFAGFLCAWLYWTCNLPFFSSLLYFIANALAEAGGPQARAAVADPSMFVAFALGLAAVVAGLHLAGLGTGKWLANFGAAAAIALLALLIVAGGLLAVRDGPATRFSWTKFALPLNADGAALWATMVFAFGGPEALALLRGDVEGGTRQVLRVLAVVGIGVTVAYMLGTLAMLSVLAPDDVSRLSGLPDALRLSLTRLGLAPMAPAAVVLLALSMLGAYSAWFGVAARLPFVIGVDRYLPAAFAWRHPRTGAPAAAILVQTLAVFALILLGQAGATVKAAYDFLVSMSVLSYTLPFVFMFVVYLKVQTTPLPPGGWTPGGAGVARLVGAVGLTVTASAIACTLVPSPEAADGLAAVAKLVLASAVLIASGVLIWIMARRNEAASNARASVGVK